MAWHRVSMLPAGVLSSRTWRGRNDDGREAVLREVPDGVTPTLNSSVVPGVVPLREVIVLDGRRYGVWDKVEAESLQDLCERVHEAGGSMPLGVLARIIVDTARTLVAITPNKPHGGLSDGAILVTKDGDVLVMDYGCPRPGRFTAAGPPSFANDVFSLGAVMHATLTGFGGTYADAITEGLPLPPPSQLHDECTPALDDVVQRAISRSVEKRQPDLELFADEVEAVLGEQLGLRKQVRAFLSSSVRPGPPVPDVDPGPAPGIDEVPTGQHPVLAHKETLTDLPPAPTKIPTGTQPGAPPADAFSRLAPPDETGPMPGIPLSTQPGLPNPALMSGPPPAETVPRAPVAPLTPRASAPKPPPPIPMETQPRLPPVLAKTVDTAENEVPTGPRPAPAPPTSVSHAKLEWAQTQARVPTPPVGVPAASASAPDLGDDADDRDEATAVRPLPKLTTQGTAPVLPRVADEGDEAPPSITDLKPASSGTLKLIALLLVVVAGVFAAVVWKLQSNQERKLARVTPTVVVDDDDDAGAAKPTPVAAPPAGDAGTTLVAEAADAGDEDTEDEDGGFEDEDGGVEEDDGGATATDAGVKKKDVKKKKPVKRRRRH